MTLIVLVALVKGIGDVGAIVYSVVFLGLSVVIGSFMTGSNTNSNVTMGAL